MPAFVVQGLFHLFAHHHFRHLLAVALGDDGHFVGLVLLELGHRFIFDGAAAVVLFHPFAGKDPGVDDHPFDPRGDPQRGVLDVAGLFPEDGPQQLFFRGELGFALGGDLPHQDVAGAHFGPQPDDAALIQVA